MSVLLNAGGLTIITSVVVFLLIILILVIIILIAKTKLMPSGNAEITINNKEKITAPFGCYPTKRVTDARHISPFCVWRKRNMRAMPLPSSRRWRRDSCNRKRTFLSQRTTGKLEIGLSSKSKRRFIHHHSRIHIRDQRMGMRSCFQSQRSIAVSYTHLFLY